ncbi:MAG: hypothetical protein QXT86_12775 [Archaeoglobaceae archaeon]
MGKGDERMLDIFEILRKIEKIVESVVKDVEERWSRGLVSYNALMKNLVDVLTLLSRYIELKTKLSEVESKMSSERMDEKLSFILYELENDPDLRDMTFRFVLDKIREKKREREMEVDGE